MSTSFYSLLAVSVAGVPYAEPRRPADARTTWPAERRARWQAVAELADDWFRAGAPMVVAIPCPRQAEWIVFAADACPASPCPVSGEAHDVLRFFSLAEVLEVFGRPENIA